MTDKNKIEIEKFLEEVAEKTDINFNSVSKQSDGSFYIEFEYWSDLGEDVIVSLVIDELTKDEILNDMYKYVEYFDAEEHATELYNLHGEHGTPTSIRALLQDADEQAEKLQEIYDVMREIITKGE